MANYKINLHKIKAFAFDVDGVFTNGSLLVDNLGQFMREYNAKDGYAVRYARKQGYPIAIITGGSDASIEHRFKKLGVDDVFLSSSYKIPDFMDFCLRYKLSPKEVLFVGDDIPDLEIMRTCGMPCCPSDAVPEIKQIAEYISTFAGGQGCVRDVIEQVLKVQEKWNVDNEIVSE